MSAIQFRTLGTLDLRAADGRELHSLLAQPKRIALFAYLCIAQPRGFHHRDTLLGLFWPNADQEHARTSLRKSLHFLRRALGDDAILSRGDEEVAIDFQRVYCDVALFEESLRADRIEEALETYRGDLLTGFFIDDAPEFDQWLHSQRTGLRASAARAAYRMSELLEEAGNIAAAVSWARRSLELADTDERTLRRLVELKCRAGDRTGAIQAYEAFSLHLAAEYESVPSAETRSLIERIRSGWEPPGANTEPKAAADRERTGQITAARPSVDGVPPALEKKPDDQFGANGKAWIRREGNKLYTVLALAILMAGVAIRGWMRPAPSRSVVQHTVELDEPMVPSTPWSGRIDISPDGSLLAYIGGPRSQLLIQPSNQLHAIPVPGTEGAASPFFSPEGKYVGFLREGIVQIASVSGGPPITVSDSLTGVAGASWGPDNFIYADGSPSLVRVEAKAGAMPHWFTKLNTAGRESKHSWPDVLPNGKGVLFTVGFCGRNGVKGASSFAIAVADIPSGKHRVILDDAMYARYAKPGYLLYVTTNKALMIVAFDQNSMKITGKPTVFTEGMRLGLLGSADLAVDTTGTLVYATGAGEGKQGLVWVTRDGEEQAVDSDWTAFYMGSPTISPDGKRIAQTQIASVEAPSSIWIKRLDRALSFKLTVDTKDNRQPAWTADGKSVTFSSTPVTMFCSNPTTDATDLWTQRADAGAPAVMQVHGKSGLYNPRWSRDGKWLIYQTAVESPGSGDILAIRPGIDTAPVPVVATRFSEISPALSPNGRWLAYVSNETGEDQIYMVPFPNPGTAKRAISEGGGTEPVWSHRGSELFYRDASGNLVAVEVNTSPTFSLGRTTVLFPAAKFTSNRFNPQYAVAPDDQRFLMVRPLETGTHDKLIFVQNWVEALKSSAMK
jgi:serine/threonine-protein kinase